MAKDKRRQPSAAEVAAREKVDYVELMRYIENAHPTIELDERVIEERIKKGEIDEAGGEPEIAF